MVKKERNQEIDIMKGLLTLAMILCHCLQFFGKEDAGIEKILVNVINLTTFSGFLFCFGFVCCLAYFQGETRRGIVHMLRNMIRLLLAFYISGIAYMAFKEQKIFRKDFLWEILTLRRYPGWSEFLASFAAVLLAGAVLLPVLRKTNGWVVMAAALISLLACFIPYGKITNPWLALFLGSESYTTFPVLQYSVYFVAGIWAAKRKKWPDWKLFFGAVVLSAPCVWYYWKYDGLPGRFPPSALFIGGGAIGVWIYHLLAGALAWLKNVTIIGKPVEALSFIGRNSLYYLLMSNLLIFAVAGSKFKYRANEYAYVFYLVLLAILTYLERQIRKNK